MEQNIELNICISDIPESAKFVAKSGKIYVKAKFVKRKEVGKYGETHFLCLPSKKDEPTVYIGSAKPIEYTPKQPTASEINNAIPVNDAFNSDDLPF